MEDLCDSLHKTEKSQKFYCGVVEGFYGRPWSTEQRRSLFSRMEQIGMDTYLYAPKDDCKHRVYWRDLYSVEEAEHLKGLINAAKEHNVDFVYALSPGLDISYSNSKEVTLLKRKLEQVAGFGCTAFALLFDDIDVDMSEADKSIFSSFAQAQVSVTNEAYQHLGQPPVFLFCPTEYCSSRAVPNVQDSEYLNTIGSRLLPGIDIFWTGTKVISKEITEEHVEALTKVLRRPPVIWDNIHANDYDQKRVFLGPYTGRSTKVMSKLQGVLTNPNTEFEANYIAMHTLAQWAKTEDGGGLTLGDATPALSESIRLETEDTEFDPCCPNGYKSLEALNIAVLSWLSELKKKVDPPSRKMVHAAPPTIAPPAVPTPIPGLDGCPSSLQNESMMQPLSSAPVNSLLDPSSSESDADSAIDTSEMECAVIPAVPIGEILTKDLNQSGYDSGVADCVTQEPMKLDRPEPFPLKVKPSVDELPPEVVLDLCDTPATHESLTSEDLHLMVELFYLPFEHGRRPVDLLHQFCWLKAFHSQAEDLSPSHSEWFSRADSLVLQIRNVEQTLNRFIEAPNKAIVQDLFAYFFDFKSIMNLADTFISWLMVADSNVKWDAFTSGNPYTWSNKYYSDAFTSGEHEPWVFRGGLQAEFQRLLPIDGVSDLLLPPFPEIPFSKMSRVRPYSPGDKMVLMSVFESCEHVEDVPVNVGFSINSEDLTEAMLDLCGDQCFILEDSNGRACGFTVASLDAPSLFNKIEANWLPVKRNTTMEKLLEGDPTEEEVEMEAQPYYMNEQVDQRYPSLLMMHLCPSADIDIFATRRLMACAAMGLRTVGTSGVHTFLNLANKSLLDELAMLKFYTLVPGLPEGSAVLGRTI